MVVTYLLSISIPIVVVIVTMSTVAANNAVSKFSSDR